MKHFRLLYPFLIILIFIVCALSSSYARNLYAIEICCIDPTEDIEADLITGKCFGRDVLSVSITCPPDVTVSCANLVPIPDFAFGLATSTCPGMVDVLHLSDVISNQICQNNYTLTRTYEATDACLNTATCTQIITVLDNIVPMITCPPNITVNCASQVPAPCNGCVLVIDCGITTTTWLGDVISNQTCPGQYVLTRTYQVFDVCGNSSSCAQLITVFDNTPAAITCPPNITISCSDDTSPSTTGTATSSDNCGQNAVISYTDMLIPGVCASGGSIERTFTATDNCGNISSCMQVISIEDINPAILSCPPSVTIVCSESTSPSNTGLATAVDDCDPSPVITYADMFVPGSCTNNGNIQRTWSAYDNCGNSSSCLQVISLVDIDPPVILFCPPSVTISCSASTLPFNTGIASAVDDCDPSPAITYADMFIPGICVNGGSIDRTFIATDNCGNTSTCLQVISVVDNIPPVISNGPVDITVTASGPSPCSMYVSISIPSAMDNCDPNVLLSNDYNFTADASDVYPEGSTLVTFIATDECGNTSTHSFMVVVNCQPPVPCGIVVHSDCNVEISGYTRLGGVSEGAPYIKMKELPLTTTGNNNNSSVPIPHGLTASKIISVSVLVESAVDHFTPPEYSTAINLRYSFSVTPTDIVIQNNTLPGDCVICSKPAKVLIIYKE